MSTAHASRRPAGIVGNCDVSGVECHLCGRVCKGDRGLQVHLRTCMKRDPTSEKAANELECPGEQQLCPSGNPLGISAVHGRGDPVVLLERCDGSVGQSRRKRRRRSAESGEEGDAIGSPRGRTAAGTTGECVPNGKSNGSRKQAKRARPAVGMTSPCSDVISSGEGLVFAPTPATSSGCVEGLSSAQTPAQGSGSVDGLVFARSSAVSPIGGSVEGNGSSIRGGRVDGLVFAQTPAVDSGMHRLSNARTATVSHTKENGNLSVANTQLLPGDAMPGPTVSRQTGGGSVGTHACGSCSFVSASVRGLRQHERRRHPADYHSALAIGHRTGNKRRWSLEEKVLVAREEIRLQQVSGDNLVARLAMAFPERTYESIKCLRHQAAYCALRDEIVRESSEVSGEGPGTVSGSQTGNVEAGGDGGGTSDPSIPSSPEEACSALAAVCRADASLLCLTADELEEIITLAESSVRNPSEGEGRRIQSLVDKEYDQWIGAGLSSSQPKASSTSQARDSGRRRRGRRSRGSRRLDREVTETLGKRARRRRLYGVIQALYRKNRSRCAKSVLSGDWAKERRPALPLEEQDAFWRPLFEEPSKPDERTPEPVCGPLFGVSLPVTLEEYELALATTHDSSPGPDCMDRRALRALDKRVGVAHMNLWLLACCPPDAFRVGVTVPIPKSADAADPAEYRPITVSSMVCRLFHRLLAHRAEGVLPLGPRQKAFREGDGLADNVWILRSIIDDCKARHRPLCVTFVDVRKAFDTVSTESVLKAAERIGFPPGLVMYMRRLYGGVFTQLRVGRTLGSLIHPRRGVRQGDPLSPLLFCAVMHWVLSRLDGRLGLGLADGVTVNHLAFADDVALVSTTTMGMKRLLSELEDGMREVGLEPNPAKSASLRISVSHGSRRWFCDPEPYLTLGGTRVPTIDIVGSYRYLGIRTSAGGKIGKEVTHRLEEGLRQLSAAPLKPQQRLFLLRAHLLPSLYHELVLSRYSKALLRYLDRRSREAVRRWLRLVHDVPQSFFHARAPDGGLGIPELMVQVPLMRRARVEKLFNRATWHHDPVLAAVIGRSKALLQERRRWKDGVACYAQSVTEKNGQGRATAAALYHSCDGCGLADAGQVPAVNRWVVSGTRVMTGRSFINALHVRAGCLYTKVRASRGRASTSTVTDAAGGVVCEVCPCKRETLAHVIQQCPRSAQARTGRHDAVVRLLTKGLTGRGFTVETEPAIATDHGVRRPDVVAYKPGKEAAIIDVTVVADIPGLLADANARKCRKYDVPDVRKWVSERAKVSPTSITVTALTFNWRGALCSQSAQDMKKLGITMPTLEIMSQRVLEWGYTAWQQSRDATWVRMDTLPSCPGYLRREGASGHTGGTTRRHFLGRRPAPSGEGPPASRRGGWQSRRPAPEVSVAASIQP